MRLEISSVFSMCEQLQCLVSSELLYRYGGQLRRLSVQSLYNPADRQREEMKLSAIVRHTPLLEELQCTEHLLEIDEGMLHSLIISLGSFATT